MAEIKNFYDELGIGTEMSIEEINGKLLQLETVWNQRMFNEPEKANSMLQLIEEAKIIFSSEESKNEYNQRLESANKEEKNDDGENFNSLYEQAQFFMESEEYELAKLSLDKALNSIKKENETTEVYLFASDVYIVNGLYDEAVKYVNNAITNDFKNPSLYYAKGMIYVKQINAIVDQNLKNQRNGLALVDLDRGLFEKGKKCFEMAMNKANEAGNSSLEGKAAGYMAYCMLRVENPDIAKAREIGERAVSLGDETGEGAVAVKTANDLEYKIIASQKRNEIIQKMLKEEIQSGTKYIIDYWSEMYNFKSIRDEGEIIGTSFWNCIYRALSSFGVKFSDTQGGIYRDFQNAADYSVYKYHGFIMFYLFSEKYGAEMLIGPNEWVQIYLTADNKLVVDFKKLQLLRYNSNNELAIRIMEECIKNEIVSENAMITVDEESAAEERKKQEEIEKRKAEKAVITEKMQNETIPSDSVYSFEWMDWKGSPWNEKTGPREYHSSINSFIFSTFAISGASVDYRNSPSSGLDLEFVKKGDFSKYKYRGWVKVYPKDPKATEYQWVDLYVTVDNLFIIDLHTSKILPDHTNNEVALLLLEKAIEKRRADEYAIIMPGKPEGWIPDNPIMEEKNSVVKAGVGADSFVSYDDSPFLIKGRPYGNDNKTKEDNVETPIPNDSVYSFNLKNESYGLRGWNSRIYDFMERTLKSFEVCFRDEYQSVVYLDEDFEDSEDRKKYVYRGFSKLYQKIDTNKRDKIIDYYITNENRFIVDFRSEELLLGVSNNEIARKIIEEAIRVGCAQNGEKIVAGIPEGYKSDKKELYSENEIEKIKADMRSGRIQNDCVYSIQLKPEPECKKGKEQQRRFSAFLGDALSSVNINTCNGLHINKDFEQLGIYSRFKYKGYVQFYNPEVTNTPLIKIYVTSDDVFIVNFLTDPVRNGYSNNLIAIEIMEHALRGRHVGKNTLIIPGKPEALILEEQEWKRLGKCRYCGGELKGLFGKKCVDCGKAKDY